MKKAGWLEKNISKNKRMAALISVGILLLLFICIGAVIGVSENYHKLNGMPAPVNGILDFADFKINDENTNVNLAGEWEFYYGTWLATDADTNRNPDAIVQIPHRWRGMEVDGETLDAVGYASYRAVFYNLPKNISIRVWKMNYVGAYRVFINGVMVTSYGDMTRDNPWCESEGYPEILESYTVQNDAPLEVIIEIGCSREGGLCDAPSVDFNEGPVQYFAFTENIGMVAFGISLSLVVLTVIVNLAMHKKEREWSFAAVIIVYFIQTIFSIDLYWHVCNILGATSYNVILEVNFVLALLLAFTAAAHFEKIKSMHIPSYIYCIGGVITYIAIVSFYTLWGSAWRFIPTMVMVLIIALMIYPIVLAMFNSKRKENIIYLLLIFLNILSSTMSIMDLMGIITFGLEGIISVCVILNTITFTVQFWFKLRHNFDTTVANERIINETTKVRSDALREQIKPHFIFNSLTSIQHLYHQSLDKGDMAMEMFSHHIRTNVNAGAKDLVPFAEELANIDNYCKLNEMRLGYPIPLILDIDCTAFEVPSLSLQPIVENSIKYANIYDKEDGYIMVQSSEDKDYIYVVVSDNGIGFDVNNIDKNSIGLKNLTERLRLMLDAEVSIESEIGEGTSVEIRIPKGREYEHYSRG